MVAERVSVEDRIQRRDGPASRDDGPLSRARLRALVRRPIVQSLLSMAVTLALLLAFHQTVAQAVQQGEQRRHAAAQRAIAEWQCNVMSSVGARRGCLLRLGEPLPAPSAGCDAVTPDGSGCVFSGGRKVRPGGASSWL